MWAGPYARRVAALESGRPVVVRYWEVQRFAPELRLGLDEWVEVRGDDVVLVEPLRSVDGRKIVGWRPAVAS
jgi:hypothetical protein